MSSAVAFMPKADMTASENLDAFIKMCRYELTVFGSELEWEANKWPTSKVTFGNIEQTSRLLNPNLVMKQPFLDFAKAYHRYKQGMEPAKANIEMRALKCLEKAIRDLGGVVSIERACGYVFEKAAEIARLSYTPGVAYRAGQQLQNIAELLSEKRLVENLLPWKNSIPRPNDATRTGAKAKADREKKLPNQKLLDALAAIFAGGPTIDRDIYTTSTVALLLSAPNRGDEVICLLENCEVTNQMEDGSPAYGLRYFPSKGAKPMIKWVPSVMEEITKEAIARVREMTNEARRIAAWYEDHPDRFYRHRECPDVAEDEPLTVEQVAQAIGIELSLSRGIKRSYLRRLGLSDRDSANTLRVLNAWVRKRLPTTFPWFDEERGLRYRDALFAMRERQLRTDMASSPVLLWRPSVNVLNNDLGDRETKVGYRAPSIFDRYRWLIGDLRVTKVTSHQFRHHLNTIAQRGGLAQSEIAMWSGRADRKQNVVYDHMSEFELADMLRQHSPALKLGTSLSEVERDLQMRRPVSRFEFNTLAVPTVHITEFGFCVHDFVMMPCQRFRDCLNCSEQVCIKGDRRLASLKLRRDEIRSQVQRAQSEIDDGTAGADRWFEVHMLALKRISQLITILEDDSVENGAIIRLNPADEFRPINVAMDVCRELVGSDQFLLEFDEKEIDG